MCAGQPCKSSSFFAIERFAAQHACGEELCVMCCHQAQAQHGFRPTWP